ncbi:MAG TPA: GNAT family N-acetyltransferase [Desulfobulbus sp.]|nr:GNAT family N-acetyltransferase [Desulfobulbus sp.]HHD63595.1 GNAT family N-acetyltransferase [Desulfobulbaceae bacterium]
MRRAGTVRRARAGDLEPLADLLEILFSIEEDFQPDRELQIQGLGLLLKNPQAVLLVAEQDSRVIGMCSGQLLISTAEGGPVVLVEDLVVAPGYRNKGTGSLLLENLTRWAADRHATRLQLLADCNNTPALDFYRKSGWQTTALICLRKK